MRYELTSSELPSSEFLRRTESDAYEPTVQQHRWAKKLVAKTTRVVSDVNVGLLNSRYLSPGWSDFRSVKSF